MTNRILFITHYLRVAGTETFMLNATRALRLQSGIQADFLIFTTEEGPNVERAKELGCRIFRLPPRSEGFAGYIRGLKDFYRKHAEEYDAVHYCAGNLSSIAPLHYARKAGIPVNICHAHNSQARHLHNKILHRLMRLFIGREANRYLACSEEAGRYFFGRRPYEVVPNGVSLEACRFDKMEREKIRNEFGIAADAPVVGYLGRICAEKNPLKMISVFRKLSEQFPEARLLIVGDGDFLEATKNEAARSGIEKRVIFTGQRMDTTACLSAMDVMFMTSFFEGLPFSVIEAQANALPCVVTDRISRQAKLSEKFVYISPEADDGVWAEAIAGMLASSNPYIRYEQPRQLTESGYAIENTARRLAELYRP